MPPRIQKTPYGDVSLTSRWKRDHYQLRACGPQAAVRWLFPRFQGFEQHRSLARHAFEPAPAKITVERELRVVCAQWQAHWDEHLQDHLDGVDAPARASSPNSTLGELCAARLAQRKELIEHATWLKERHYLQHWRDELGDALALSALTEDILRAASKALAKRLKPGTLNGSQATFKSMIAWGREQGALHHSPETVLRKLKDPRDPTAARWWTSEEIARALSVAEQDAHQPTAVLLVAVGCYAGLRYEEIVMLRWPDLDLDAVSPDGKPQPVCHVVPHDGWTPKDGEARTVPIPTRLHQILLQHRRPDGYLLEPEPVKKRSVPVRPRKDNGVRTYRYDARAVWRRMMKKLKDTGGRPINLNGMRHSFASNLLMAGVSDVKVARWLGHANTEMVHEHYGHLLSYDDNINRGT